MGEQRKFQRVPQDLRAELEGGLGDEREPRGIRITDLSSGGVGFESSVPLFVGEVVEFEIPLARPIRATAQVVWSVTSAEPRKYGAVFKNMDVNERIVLRSHLHLQMNALGLEPLEGDN